jgi:hypothetical protein
VDELGIEAEEERFQYFLIEHMPFSIACQVE